MNNFTLSNHSDSNDIYIRSWNAIKGTLKKIFSYQLISWWKVPVHSKPTGLSEAPLPLISVTLKHVFLQYGRILNVNNWKIAIESGHPWIIFIVICLSINDVCQRNRPTCIWILFIESWAELNKKKHLNGHFWYLNFSLELMGKHLNTLVLSVGEHGSTPLYQ